MKFVFTMLLVLGMAGGWVMSIPAVAQDGKAPLVFELPPAFAGGTPCEYWGPTLEPEDYKERPPFLAPVGTVLVSRGKPVTSSVASPVLGRLNQITDGEKSHVKKSVVELESGLQWVQIDLEQETAIYAILFWHFFERKRVYFDLVVTIGNDPGFKDGGQVVYNNDHDNSGGLGVGKDTEFIGNERGRLIGLPDGVKGRYVRLYSKGNSDNAMNHYIEVEVFGKPAGGQDGMEPLKIEIPAPSFN